MSQPYRGGIHWMIGMIALCALAVSLAPAARPALAQSGPRVTASPAPTYTFGQAVTFRLQAASDVALTEATLFLRTPDEPRTFVGKARFQSGLTIEAIYQLEPAQRHLEPFSPVEYWWELNDKAGHSLTTSHETFTYGDNRFTWQTLTEARVTVAWYDGDRAFGQAALDIAVEALAHINRDVRVPQPRPVTVYLYSQLGDAREALRSANRLWAEGRANPRLNVVVLTMPPREVDTQTRLGREIPHELTHLLIGQLAGEQFGNVPNWLNEGLASMNEGAPDANAPALLAQAQQAHTLPSLASLCAPFPADPAQAQLAYAESEAVVRYIHDRFGSLQISQLISAYADGLDCENGVQRVLKQSLTQLEQDWQHDALAGNPADLAVHLFSPWLVISGLVLLAAVLVTALIIFTRPAPSKPMV